MKIKTYVVKFLLYLVSKLSVTEARTTMNRQDLELLHKNFPVFQLSKDMTAEQITLGYVKSVGEQRVVQYIAGRITGRAGQGVAYD